MPPPDADLHPEATGLAKELVNKHSAPQPLKLYAGWFCPFGMNLGLQTNSTSDPNPQQFSAFGLC